MAKKRRQTMPTALRRKLFKKIKLTKPSGSRRQRRLRSGKSKLT